MNKAVFLDRDGVINYNVFNAAAGQWESPCRSKDLKLFPWTILALQKLQENNFFLFLVSNQPGYAKGKATLENIKAIHAKLHSILISNKVSFAEYFYCYHHPQGIKPELQRSCECRKPGIFFLEEAKRKYFLDMGQCWMVGDRDSDIICGQNAGTKTILVWNAEEAAAERAGKISPDFKVHDLLEAVNIILQKAGEHAVT